MKTLTLILVLTLALGLFSGCEREDKSGGGTRSLPWEGMFPQEFLTALPPKQDHNQLQ